MTLAVALADLPDLAAAYTSVPLALTVDDDGRPRAAAVAVRWRTCSADDARRMRRSGTGVAAGQSCDLAADLAAGHRTVRNAAARPAVSLLWPADDTHPFALLVDLTTVSVRLEHPDGTDRGAKPGGRVETVVLQAVQHVLRARAFGD